MRQWQFSPENTAGTSPQQSNNLAYFSRRSLCYSPVLGTQFVPGCACKADHVLGQTMPEQRGSMQNGSVIRAERRRGADVWEFRWREPGADGKRKHRRMVLGSVEQLAATSNCSSGNFCVTARVQPRRCVAQDEINNTLRPCFRLP